MEPSTKPRTQSSEFRMLFNVIHEDCNKLVIMTIIKITFRNEKKNEKKYISLLIRNGFNNCLPILSSCIKSWRLYNGYSTAGSQPPNHTNQIHMVYNSLPWITLP